MKERKLFIDVARGILIAIVVFHHFPHVVKLLGYSDTLCETIYKVRIVYTPFFMSAFFIITGYCSNFRKDLVSFIVGNIKSILLPAFTLGAISVWINLAGEGCSDWTEYCKVGIKTLLMDGGPYWFLSSLFVAKIFFWGTIRINWGGGLSIIGFIIGLYLSSKHSNYEHWSVYHALILLPNLFVGKMIKDWHYDEKLFQPKWFLTIIVVYVTALLVCQNIFSDVPYVTHRIHVPTIEIPLYIILSISGSLAVLTISKAIRSRTLNYLGRKSLYIYCLHIAFLFVFVRIVGRLQFWDISLLLSLILAFVCIVLTIVLALLVERLLNSKYLRFTIGMW